MSERPRPRAPMAALLKWLRYEAHLGAGLSSSAAHVLAVIAGYVSTAGEAWPSVPTLMYDTGASESTVQRALREILTHPRAPLARTLGAHHAAASYEVTGWPYAALERRGVYARVDDPEAIPKAPGAAGVADPASGAQPSAVASAPPRGAGAPVERAHADSRPTTDAPTQPLAAPPVRAGGVSSMTPLDHGGVSSMTPLDRGGVSPMTPRGVKFDFALRKKGPLKGDSKTTISAAAAAAAVSEQEQQQQQRDLADAQALVSAIVGLRGDRIVLGAGKDLAGKPPAPLTVAAVVAEASTFTPNPGAARVVRTPALERMSPQYLARTLYELRAWHEREAQAWRAESETSRADVDDVYELAVQPDRARNTWDLIAARLEGRVDPYAWGTWVRPLEGVDLRRGRLLVVGPDEHFAAWAQRHAEAITAAAAEAGLTCVVEVVARQELRGRLEADCDGRGPPARAAMSG